MKSALSINYLRHGIVKTGGVRHEEFLFECLQKALDERRIPNKPEKKIAAKIFRGFANIKLLLWGFREANASVNIVVGRLALSSVLRNVFTRKKTLIVLHNYDENDGKGGLLRYYYKVLFLILRKASPQKVAIIAVSPFFQKYFNFRFPHLPVFLFPNLFDKSYYSKFRQERNPKKILLGQYSSKMDATIYRLAEKLSKTGFECFFCTLREEEAGEFDNYSVKFLSFESYLNEMARSYCSLSLSGVNEGWPRMVHESLLVGTPVIGYEKGGLGDLLWESNSYIVKNESEAFELISAQKVMYNVSPEFINKYDSARAGDWLKPVIEYICV